MKFEHHMLLIALAIFVFYSDSKKTKIKCAEEDKKPDAESKDSQDSKDPKDEKDSKDKKDETAASSKAKGDEKGGFMTNVIWALTGKDAEGKGSMGMFQYICCIVLGVVAILCLLALIIAFSGKGSSK